MMSDMSVCKDMTTHCFKIFGQGTSGQQGGEAGHEGQDPGARETRIRARSPKQEHKGLGQLQDVAEGGRNVLGHRLKRTSL